MKQKVWIALITAAAITPVAAQAQFYVGANVGRSMNKLSLEDVNSVKDNATAAKLYGGYQFDANFGIEGGYADMGRPEFNVDGETSSGKLHSLYFAAAATMPLSDSFSLVGKIGFAKHRATLLAAGQFDRNLHKTAPMFGLGATYVITPCVMAVVEYDNFGKVYDVNAGNQKTSAVSVGLRFKF